MTTLFSKNVAGDEGFSINSASFDDLKKFSLENELRSCKKKETIYSEGNNSIELGL